jgi:hypothetical protein
LHVLFAKLCFCKFHADACFSFYVLIGASAAPGMCFPNTVKGNRHRKTD